MNTRIEKLKQEAEALVTIDASADRVAAAQAVAEKYKKAVSLDPANLDLAKRSADATMAAWSEHKVAVEETVSQRLLQWREIEATTPVIPNPPQKRAGIALDEATPNVPATEAILNKLQQQLTPWDPTYCHGLAEASRIRQRKKRTGRRVSSSPSPNPFQGQLQSIQATSTNISTTIIWWRSRDECDRDHVKEVVRATTNLGRSILVNTGIHGTEDGNIGCGEFKFVQEDLQILSATPGRGKAAIHVISERVPALRPARSIDVIDAYCFSDKSGSYELTKSPDDIKALENEKKALETKLDAEKLGRQQSKQRVERQLQSERRARQEAEWEQLGRQQSKQRIERELLAERRARQDAERQLAHLQAQVAQGLGSLDEERRARLVAERRADEAMQEELARQRAKEQAGVSDLAHPTGQDLHDAVRHKDKCAVLELLDKGAPIEWADPVYKRTALHWACMMVHPELVQTLLSRGANVEAPDGFTGETALMSVVMRSDLPFHDLTKIKDVIKKLLAAGADPNATDKGGRNVLQFTKHPARVSSCLGLESETGSNTKTSEPTMPDGTHRRQKRHSRRHKAGNGRRR